VTSRPSMVAVTVRAAAAVPADGSWSVVMTSPDRHGPAPRD
jgi:hypothetical protein